MAISNLTNTKWKFNDIIDSSTFSYGEYNLEGVAKMTVNGEEISINMPTTGENNFCLRLSSYSAINYPFVNNGTYRFNYFYYRSNMGSTNGWKYINSSSTTENGSNAKIEITGGSDVTNTALINWFEANATQIVDPQPQKKMTLSQGKFAIVDGKFVLVKGQE